jgi:manganese/iron transport system permease protein
MDLQEIFLDPITKYQFMERALLAVLMVGSISGVVGSFVVVRGMSFFGDALAHSILPGVAIAYLYGRDLFLGGMVAGVGTALGIGWLTRGKRIREDTAIGVVFAGMLALGVGLISTTGSYSLELTEILFGNVLGVSPGDLQIMAVCVLGVYLLIFIFYKEFLLVSFDPGLARTLKLSDTFFNLLLLVLVAVTIVASLRTVGVSLMIALLVTPAATAQLLIKRFHLMMVIASFLAMGSGTVGLYLSYYQDIASGPAIVLVATGVFLVVFTGSEVKKLAQNRAAAKQPGLHG